MRAANMDANISLCFVWVTKRNLHVNISAVTGRKFCVATDVVSQIYKMAAPRSLTCSEHIRLDSEP